MKTRVKEYVQFNQLDKPNRHREKNYKRIILANILREEGITMAEIGKIMNRHHATIINMMKNYVFLKNYADFRREEARIKKELECYTLEEKILKVDNMADLHWLQEEIRKSLQN